MNTHIFTGWRRVKLNYTRHKIKMKLNYLGSCEGIVNGFHLQLDLTALKMYKSLNPKIDIV